MADVLVVDDIPVNRQLLVTLLGYKGHRVFEAGDGEQAISVLRSQQIDLIITDIVMPNLDGIAFIERLRANASTSSIPIILYTAHFASDAACAIARTCGVRYLITKPADPEQIYLVVEQALVEAAGLPVYVDSGRSPRVALSERRTAAGAEQSGAAPEQQTDPVMALKAMSMHLSALLEVGIRLASVHDLETLCSTFCDTAARLVNARYAAIGLLDDAGQERTHYFVSDPNQARRTAAARSRTSRIPDPQRVPADTVSVPPPALETILGSVLALQRPRRFSVKNPPPEKPALVSSESAITSFLAVPISTPSRIYGWLYAVNKIGTSEFVEEDERMALTLAARVAVSLENARLWCERETHIKNLQEEVKARAAAESEARRRAEETEQANIQLNTVLSSMEDGLFQVDLEGKVVYLNPAAEKILGWTFDDVRGGEIHCLIHAPLPRCPAGDCPFLAVMKTGVPCRTSEERFFRKDGSPIIVQVSAAPVIVHDSAIGAVVLFADITAEKEKERQSALLAEKADELQAASRLKNEFIANTSHELRTPLSAILGANELLLGTELSEEQLELASVVQQSAKTLLELVNDILDLSKAEAGKMSLESIEIRPAAVVAEAIDTFANSVRKKQLAITSNIDQSLPPAVFGDRGRLRQILINLVGNAVKFTHQGGVTIGVTLEEENEEDVLLKFTVSDTGIGIAESEQRFLFLPYTQVDGSTARRFGGTGLGLSLSKQLAELMGGTVGVSSKKDEGSTFWFTVRMLRTGPETPAVDDSAPVVPVTIGDGEILVVEDNPVLQSLALNQLARLGLKASAVSDGESALVRVGEKSYSLILMDCYLPGCDGFETTRSIRRMQASSHEHTPIIAITASAMKGDAEKCADAGMDDYLSKPYTLEQLKRKIYCWLARE